MRNDVTFKKCPRLGWRLHSHESVVPLQSPLSQPAKRTEAGGPPEGTTRKSAAETQKNATQHSDGDSAVSASGLLGELDDCALLCVALLLLSLMRRVTLAVALQAQGHELHARSCSSNNSKWGCGHSLRLEEGYQQCALDTVSKMERPSAAATCSGIQVQDALASGLLQAAAQRPSLSSPALEEKCY
ncbi:hypothetical protein SKAU_G00231630 [Synaphobranchus kaupii]|uniref:Uncharacterized protein n=1 Tax=Synaphobranchus kaupii TaxID=118154 RepID=A0A9Q1IT14_SYNKA|nr:hypothetical protein SKAU_G00231630 [Synaphobranchus kaupii]